MPPLQSPAMYHVKLQIYDERWFQYLECARCAQKPVHMSRLGITQCFQNHDAEWFTDVPVPRSDCQLCAAIEMAQRSE